jgi:hypothetical protein
MRILDIIGRAQIVILNISEEAAWLASNPGSFQVVGVEEDDDLLYFTYVDGDFVQQYINISGGGGGDTIDKIYVRSYSGTTYSNAGLIGADVLLFMMDSVVRYEVTSSPDPGSEFTFDTDTGIISIGTNFDENDLYIQFKSVPAPPVSS